MPWTGQAPLLLASTSRTRRSLLEAAGISVDVEAPGTDERALEARSKTLAPQGLASLLAREKALAVSGRNPGRIVIGADQVLALDGRAHAKAVDRREAAEQLRRLSGRRHRLLSAFTLARDGRVVENGLDGADLSVRVLDEVAIERYLDRAGDVATRSAGGYEVEGLGIHLFEQIEGEHTTVLGLPLLPVLAALRRLGLLAF